MIVGLTGGIGSGKTTVANMFRTLGVPVYDSDLRAKELMQTSPELKEQLKALLGVDAYKGEKLNKTYIAEKVFKRRELLQRLNALVHPAVKNDFIEWVNIQEYPYVIQETALIFENDMQSTYDAIILVTAAQPNRIERVRRRDKVSEQEVLDRMANQLPDIDKISRSDFVIENMALEKTNERVVEIHHELLRLSRKN